MGNLAVRVFAGLLLAFACLAAKAQPELVFGVYPYLTATEIVDQYALLRDYVARITDRPVSMVSARDFPAFIDRTRSGDYDLVFTAPHMGRLAEIRDGWRQVVQTGFRMEIVILTRKDSRIRQLEDLRNRSISVGS
jgi:phosphonate transport system substrate-binding protein